MPRLLVQVRPILAFGLLEYYRLIKRIIKEIRILTWTLKKKSRREHVTRKKMRFSVVSDSVPGLLCDLRQIA